MQRQIAKKYKMLPLNELEILLHSKYHEERLTALHVLVEKFKKANKILQKKIYGLYMNNTKFINNWDLVDSSAHYTIGPYLENRDKSILYNFAKSPDIWERRIAIMTTFYFIKQNKYDDTIAISKILLNDAEDLIHKAVGWMLREIGNREMVTEINFLNEHYKHMPRTMLRYAIEKFPEELRKDYLNGKI